MVEDFEYVFNHNHEFEKVPLTIDYDRLGKNEVVVKPKFVGICGSDIFLIKLGLVNLRLGHEWIGEVCQVGTDVTTLKIGDLVTGSGHFCCEKCPMCLKGFSNLCENPVHFSSDKMGALRSAFLAPEGQVVRVTEPLDISLSLLEIFGVGEHAYDLAKENLENLLGQKILILGAGPIGLATAFAFRSYGLDFIIVEKNNFRVQNARTAGFKSMPLTHALLDEELKNRFSVIVDCSNDYVSGDGAFPTMTYFSQKKFLGLVVGKYINPIQIPNAINAKAANLVWMRGVPNSCIIKTVAKWSKELKSIKKHFIFETFDVADIAKAIEIAQDRSSSIKTIVKI